MGQKRKRHVSQCQQRSRRNTRHNSNRRRRHSIGMPFEDLTDHALSLFCNCECDHNDPIEEKIRDTRLLLSNLPFTKVKNASLRKVGIIPDESEKIYKVDDMGVNIESNEFTSTGLELIGDTLPMPPIPPMPIDMDDPFLDQDLDETCTQTCGELFPTTHIHSFCEGLNDETDLYSKSSEIETKKTAAAATSHKNTSMTKKIADAKTFFGPDAKPPSGRCSRFTKLGGDAEVCTRCGRFAYNNERVKTLKNVFHLQCFHCKRCKAPLSRSNWNYYDNFYYCDPCHKASLSFKPGL